MFEYQDVRAILSFCNICSDGDPNKCHNNHYNCVVVGNAEGDDEMDIDDTTAGTVADESAYIGDNCLSTPVRFKNYYKFCCFNAVPVTEF